MFWGFIAALVVFVTFFASVSRWLERALDPFLMKLPPYAFLALRVAFGTSLFYAAFYAKVIHNNLALEVAYRYPDLVHFFGFEPHFLVLGAAIIEILNRDPRRLHLLRLRQVFARRTALQAGRPRAGALTYAPRAAAARTNRVILGRSGGTALSGKFSSSIMTHQYLREIAKVGIGLVVADLLSVIWFSSAGFFPLTILGVTWTSSAVVPIVLFDSALILLLAHYSWNMRLPIESPSERATLKIVGTIFFVVALLHLTRIAFGWELLLGSVLVPVWVSWFGVIIPGYLSFSSFHFASRR